MVIGGALVLLWKHHRDAIEKERRTELQAAEQKYRRLIETTDTGYVILDDRGRVTDANREYVRLTGRTRLEDILGHSVLEWTAPEHHEHNATAFRLCLDQGYVRNLEIDYLGPQGKVTPVEVNATVLMNGEALSILSLCRDITERKRVEAALELANRTLAEKYEQLKKIDTIKDGLLRDVTHELKTPVAKQAMQIELLRSSLGADCTARAGRIIDVMEESVKRQERVIKNLLDLSRLEEGGRRREIRPVRPDSILDAVLQEYRSHLEETGMDVSLIIPPLFVNGDEELLWHIFSNLVNNAIKFRKREGGGRLEISAAPEGVMTVLRFRDHGIGLGPEELAHAFERFYQAAPSAEGCGVGLAICRMMVTEMGGSITLESEGRGQGATAAVSLPSA
jgi:PAS domain S-box-containing protein